MDRHVSRTAPPKPTWLAILPRTITQSSDGPQEPTSAVENEDSVVSCIPNGNYSVREPDGTSDSVEKRMVWAIGCP
jgi:hypothetical protein